MLGQLFRTALLLAWTGVGLSVFAFALFKVGDVYPSQYVWEYLQSGTFQGSALGDSGDDWQIRGAMEEGVFFILVASSALALSAVSLLVALLAWLPDRLQNTYAYLGREPRKNRTPSRLRTVLRLLLPVLALAAVYLVAFDPIGATQLVEPGGDYDEFVEMSGFLLRAKLALSAFGILAFVGFLGTFGWFPARARTVALSASILVAAAVLVSYSAVATQKTLWPIWFGGHRYGFDENQREEALREILVEEGISEPAHQDYFVEKDQRRIPLTFFGILFSGIALFVFLLGWLPDRVVAAKRARG